MYRANPKPEFLYTLRQLIRCTQAFERYSGTHVRQMGLTESQFDVIATLGNTQGMSCKELGERTLITKGTLTGVLDRMEARGLITRKADCDDARRSHVALTRKGTVLFEDVFPDAGFIPMQHIGGIPHRVMALDVANARTKWSEARHPLLSFMCETSHPDIDISAAEDIVLAPIPAPVVHQQPAMLM